MRRPLSLLRSYHAGPSRFGTYPVLQASSALTSYPTPLPVPHHIVRPAYVPLDFFGDSSGVTAKHAKESPVAEKRINLGGDDERAVRRVAKMAAEVLQEIGKLVKVRFGNDLESGAV